MSIFEKKRELPRSAFREILRKSSPHIPGAGGKIYSWRERVKMEKEIFPESRFRTHISEIECKRRLRELRTTRLRAKTREEKLNIDRKIRFLKEVTGVKPY